MFNLIQGDIAMKKFIKTITTLIVAVLTMLVFVACVPSDAESAVKKLEKEGYAVTSYTIDAEGVESAIIAKEKGLFELDFVVAIWFESVDDAKAFVEGYKLNAGEEIKRSGKCVYYGSEDAVEDFED